MVEEHPRVGRLSRLDRPGVGHRLLSDRVLTRRVGGGGLQPPGVGRAALGQVGEHRPVRRLQARQGEAVRLVEVLEGGTRTVAGIGCSRERHRLAVAVYPHDALEADIEVVGQGTFGEDRQQRRIGQVFGLLLRIGDHRDVRVYDAAPDRLARAEAVAAHRPLRVQLARGDPCRQLGLGQSFAE
jgi:hypothetical protein